MDAESFTALALRVISHEATGEDQRALETELAAHPERKDELQQLRITHEILRTAAPMIEAQSAQEPVLPAHRVNELRTAVRQHFGPAAQRASASKSPSSFSIWRWLFAGGGMTVATIVMVLLIFANSAIEIGQYRTDVQRSGDKALSQTDVPSSHIVLFDQDASFDQWQKQPLAWYQHAKIWPDNEKDQLHIIWRDKHGVVTTIVQPLAPTADAQREQIAKAVESVR